MDAITLVYISIVAGSALAVLLAAVLYRDV